MSVEHAWNISGMSIWGYPSIPCFILLARAQLMRVFVTGFYGANSSSTLVLLLCPDHSALCCFLLLSAICSATLPSTLKSTLRCLQ